MLLAIGTIKEFLYDEEGATAVEYSIMASAIAAVIVAIVFAIGIKVGNQFGGMNDSMTTQGM